jgi:hypothetical protein
MAAKVDRVAVLRYYRERPGQGIHYRDCAKDLNIAEEYQGNVSTALSRVVRDHPEYGFEVFGGFRSGHYVYKGQGTESQPTESLPMVEIVGMIKTEDAPTMVVRDETGNLSLWRKVEV